MKKVLSLALVLVLVFCMMPVKTFAATTAIVGFSDGDDILDDSEVHDFGKLILGKDTQVLKMDIKYFNMTYTHNNGNKLEFNEVAANSCVMEFWNRNARLGDPAVEKWDEYPDSKVFISRYNIAPGTPSTDPEVTITAMGIGEVDMMARMCWVDSTTNKILWRSEPIDIVGAYLDPTLNKRITSISGMNVATGPSAVVHWNGRIFDPNDLTSMNVRPGDTISFKLHTDQFNWNPDIDKMAASVRKGTLDNDQVSALITVAKGKDLLESVRIEDIGGMAHIVVRFKKDFVSVKERDFDFNVALAQHDVTNADSFRRYCRYNCK